MTVLRQGMNNGELYLGVLTTTSGKVFEVVTDRENGKHLGVVRSKAFKEGFQFWRRVSAMVPLPKMTEEELEAFGSPLRIVYSAYCTDHTKAEELCHELEHQGLVVTLSGLTLEECTQYTANGNLPDINLLNRGLGLN